MVHALKEIRRVLTYGGYLIDLRPFVAKPPIEIVSGDKIIPAGFVDDSHDFPDYLAANDAVAYMTANGLFSHEQSDTFDLYTYWDTMAEFKTYMDTGTTSILPSETLATVEQLLSRLGSTARIRERLNMTITRYRKTTPS
jgi:hypothetical protein